ncbi:DUF5959 family protein [Streptomyces sp. NPDC088553]|uniref:DUF5959 family protein n=1 Tax=Streptomyces sp. NPDC088553 TaxID=3365864 RepID=UPI0037FDDB24
MAGNGAVGDLGRTFADHHHGVPITGLTLLGEDDQDQISVTVVDQQTTRVTISLEVNRGWIEEQRELLHGIRRAWRHVHPTALR